jgi:putative nucleotidyltransferase with HDIG domain
MFPGPPADSRVEGPKGEETNRSKGILSVPVTESGRRIPSRLSSVPAFPPIATRLLAALSDANVEVPAVVEIIAGDPIFSGSILQFANSVEFGLKVPITSIRQAVMMLGLDRTRQIVAGVATSVYIRAALHKEELRRCWRHTVACAILAEQIAEASGRHSGQAYTAGILHDIGRLGLLVAYPKKYEKIVRDAAHQSLDILDFEREHFGVDHAEAGRWLVEKWRLPEDFALVAGRHHDRPEEGQYDLHTMIHVACRLADYLGYEVTSPLLPLEADEILADLPPLPRERIAAALPEIGEKIETRLLLFEKDSGMIRSNLPVLLKEEVEEPPPLPEPVAEDEEPERSGTAILVAVAALCFLLFLTLWVNR